MFALKRRALKALGRRELTHVAAVATPAAGAKEDAHSSTATMPSFDLGKAVASGRADSGELLSEELRELLRESIRVLESAFERYGSAHVATAFNGGKDATVVLHLVRAVACTRANATEQGLTSLPFMYLVEKNAFPEVDNFVRDTVAQYKLNVVEQEGGFKAGIHEFVEQRRIAAFVMGTRRTDPNAESMEAFMPSSPGWPEFMRVNPILNWEYKHVWEFLRVFQLPYCELYDRGYTSIGNVLNTQPNPALQIRDREESGIHNSRKSSDASAKSPMYGAAWTLENAELERAGRT